MRFRYPEFSKEEKKLNDSLHKKLAELLSFFIDKKSVHFMNCLNTAVAR